MIPVPIGVNRLGFQQRWQQAWDRICSLSDRRRCVTKSGTGSTGLPVFRLTPQLVETAAVWWRWKRWWGVGVSTDVSHSAVASGSVLWSADWVGYGCWQFNGLCQISRSDELLVCSWCNELPDERKMSYSGSTATHCDKWASEPCISRCQVI